MLLENFTKHSEPLRVSTVPRIEVRLYCSTRWCSSTLFQQSERIFEKQGTPQMDWGRWNDFVTTALIRLLFMGHIKSSIYKTPIDPREELKTKIRTEINEINLQTLNKVWPK